jgi:hypothetical protein
MYKRHLVPFFLSYALQPSMTFTTVGRRALTQESTHVVGEVPAPVHSPKGGAPEGVSEPQENTQVQEPPLAQTTLF